MEKIRVIVIVRVTLIPAHIRPMPMRRSAFVGDFQSAMNGEYHVRATIREDTEKPGELNSVTGTLFSMH